MFSNREDAKKAGWFSRKHQDPMAMQAASKKYQEHGKEGRKLRADARASVRALRTPEQQIMTLRDRVGPDGARREIKRLSKPPS